MADPDYDAYQEQRALDERFARPTGTAAAPVEGPYVWSVSGCEVCPFSELILGCQHPADNTRYVCTHPSMPLWSLAVAHGSPPHNCPLRLGPMIVQISNRSVA